MVNKKRIAIGFISLLILGISFYFASNKWFSDWGHINTVIGAICAGLIGLCIQYFVNFPILQLSDKNEKIGLINYYDSFQNTQDKIREAIEHGSSVDIFLMYGVSFFSNSSDSIKKMLQKTGSQLRVFLFDEENSFVQAYSDHWIKSNDTYTKELIQAKINETVNDILIPIKEDLDSRRLYKGKLEIYKVTTAPINYSFYRIDDQLFFVPSKNKSSKQFIPHVFHVRKTKNENCIYNKIEVELDDMINENEFTLINV